jgi:CAAX protease family protein
VLDDADFSFDPFRGALSPGMPVVHSPKTLVCSDLTSTLIPLLLIAGLKILTYLLATVLLGAVLAPWIFWTGQYASKLRFLGFLAGTDFQRFFNRSIFISAVLLLLPAVRWIGAKRFSNLGLTKDSRGLEHLVGGFLVSCGTILALGGALLALGDFDLKNPIPWHLLAPVALTAFSVAIIEELFFRGAILGLLRQSFAPVPAAVFVSMFFSIVHFLKPGREQMNAVHWYSGFELLPRAFWQFSDPLLVAGGFVTIGILGLILAHATMRTSSLWLAIGIHSGLIFAKMGLNKLTRRLQDLTPWFGNDITVGVGSIATLLFLWFMIWFIFLRAQPDSTAI